MLRRGGRHQRPSPFLRPMLCGRLRDASAATGAHAAADSGHASVYAIWRSPPASGACGQEQLHVLLDLRRHPSPCCLHSAVGLADAAERVEELYGVSLRSPPAEGASSANPGEALWALLCAAAASPHGCVAVHLPGESQPAAVAVRHFAAGVHKDVLVRVPPDVEEARLQPVDDATGLRLYRSIVQHLLDAREQQVTEAAAGGGLDAVGGADGGRVGEAGTKRPAPMMIARPRKGAGVAIAVSAAPPALRDDATEEAHHPA
jgi:hypothetical protein